MAELSPLSTEDVRRAHPLPVRPGGLGPSHSRQRPHSRGSPHRPPIPKGAHRPPPGGDSVFTLRPHSENFNYFEREREKGEGGRGREASICHSLRRSLVGSPGPQPRLGRTRSDLPGLRLHSLLCGWDNCAHLQPVTPTSGLAPVRTGAMKAASLVCLCLWDQLGVCPGGR